MSTLQDEYLEKAAQDFADDIDFEVLANLMINSGWTKVILNPMTSETSNEIDQWIIDNCRSNHLARGLVWVFEDPKEASWFTLRWLE